MSAARVVVAVEWPGETQVHDLEVPSDVPSARLLQLIAQALGYGDADQGDLQHTGRLHADPPGRIINRTETLAQAGVVNGASLRVDLPPGSPLAQAASSTPVIQLGTDEPLFEFSGPDVWGDLLPVDDLSAAQLPPKSDDPDDDESNGYVWIPLR